MGKAGANFVIRLKNLTYSIKNLTFRQGRCPFCHKIQYSTYSNKNIKFWQGRCQFCHKIKQLNLFNKKSLIRARQKIWINKNDKIKKYHLWQRKLLSTFSHKNLKFRQVRCHFVTRLKNSQHFGECGFSQGVSSTFQLLVSLCTVRDSAFF